MTEDKTKCTGCGACAEICNQKAISMVADTEGFIYPQINSALCNACGKCSTSCEIKPVIPADYGIAFRNADRLSIEKSSSGGAFSAISEAFWEKYNNGVVFGASFDKDMKVVHIGLKKNQGIESLHGSKYVQSNMGDTVSQINNLLKNNIAVLFTGTPCQCSAIRNLFGNNEKLLIVDLICNGVTSPVAFRKYLTSLSNTNNSIVVSYNFRNKKYEKGRGMFCMFENGTTIENTHGKDKFCKMYMNNMISRPSCSNCRFTTPNRNSDITIGDFHGLETVDSTFYSDGTSLIIPHTSTGKEFSKLVCKKGENKSFTIKQCLQPRLQNPPKSHIMRKFILKDFLSLSDEMFDRKYGKII